MGLFKAGSDLQEPDGYSSQLINMFNDYNLLIMKLTPKCTLSSSSVFSLYEEDKVAFFAGRYICLKQIRSSSCNYILLPQTVETIMAIQCLAHKKSILTIERLKDNSHSLSIYTIKGERKYLKLGIQPTAASIATAQNDINIVHCLLTFQEGTKLIQVDLAKMKIIAQAFLSEQITEIQVSPTERNLISVCGNGILRLYQTRQEGYEQIMDLLKKPEGKEFIAHMWFDSIILLACTANDIYYFRDNEILRIIPNSMSTSIKAISKVSQYFMVATENAVGIFSRNDDDVQLYQTSEVEGNIVRMEVNQQEDQVILQFDNLDFAISSIDTNGDQESSSDKTPLLKWLNRPTIGSISPDNVSICQNKSLALFVDKQREVIEIWNIEIGSCLLKKQFNRSTDNIHSSLVAGDLHPNGYSIALAFNDRVRLYHLTVQDIILYDQINSKRIKMIKFSHGGHLLAYISGKGKNSVVGIINVYTGQQIMNTKINTDLEYLCWSNADDQLAAAGDTNIYNWRGGAGWKEREDIYLSQKISSLCYDYRSGRLLVCASGEVFEIETPTKINNIPVQIPKAYSILSNVNKYIATDVQGTLYVDVDLSFNKAERLPISNGRAKVFNYLCHLLCIGVTYNELIILKSRDESKIRSQDFTLITRTEIVKNREKLRNLQELIETYRTELMARLQHERVKFKEVKSIEQEKFSNETLKMNQEFINLTAEKMHIEKVSGHLFKTVEEKQLKAVETLEVLYEQKLGMERRKIMDLEQKILEQNVYFERSVNVERSKHAAEIQELKRELNNKSNKEEIQQKIREREEELMSEYEIKLELLQFENQNYADNIQHQANSNITDLHMQISNLKRRLNMSQVENETMRLEADELKREQEGNRQRFQTSELRILESQNKIASLQKQVMWKDDLIKDKENKLYEYQYKIADLEKSKQVMNFRTTEIWRELEPKESEVDRLKKKLYKLETEFKDASKDNYNSTQKLIKAETLIDHLKKDVIQIKNKLKSKETEYNQLALQIHRVVNDVEPRVRGTEILKVYQDLKFKKPNQQHKLENEKTDQLNRHLVHLEQSLHQVNISNDRYLKNKEDEMIRKMKENAELLTEINSLRKKKKDYESEIEMKDNEIKRLARELKQMTKTSSKRAISEHTTGMISMTAGTSSRKRNIKSSQVPMRPVESLETSFRMDNKPSYSTMRTRQTRILSANRTAIINRGMNESHAQRTQVSEIAQQLDIANRRIIQQQRIIDELNRRLMNGSTQP